MTEDDFIEQVNRAQILEVKRVTDSDIDDAILRIREWMLNNPRKVKDNVIRTGRVLQFLSDKPNRSENRQGTIREF